MHHLNEFSQSSTEWALFSISLSGGIQNNEVLLSLNSSSALDPVWSEAGEFSEFSIILLSGPGQLQAFGKFLRCPHSNGSKIQMLVIICL